MNFPTILIALAVAALFGLAVRYLAKNGTCAACEDRDACRAAKEDGSPDRLSPGCGTKCSSCQYYEYERKASAKKRRTGA